MTYDRQRFVAHAATLLVVAASAAFGSASTASAATHTCDGLKATISGTSGNNTIRGTSGNDVIWAGPGNDTIYGYSGNDVICGNEGADTIDAGKGNDVVFAGTDYHYRSHGKIYSRGDTIVDGPGNDFYSPDYDGKYPQVTKDRISWYNTPKASGTPNGVTIDAGTHTAVGLTSGTDHWVGDRAVLSGSKYNDVIDGGPKNDVLLGSAGNDRINGQGGDDLIYDQSTTTSSYDTDTIDGGAGNDVIYSRRGPDTVLGGAGDDWIKGSVSADKIDGGADDDTIVDWLKLDGSSAYEGGVGSDVLYLYADFVHYYRPRLDIDMNSGVGTIQSKHPYSLPMHGIENLRVYGFPLTYRGTDAHDRVWSDGAGTMYVDARGGDDTIEGGRLVDQVDGGAGTDTLVGGGHTDHCTSIETVASGRCG